MSGWTVNISPEAEKDLSGFDAGVQGMIIKKLEWLESNFDAITPIPLKGEFREFYKLRIGDVRVVYTVDWKSKVIRVCYIARRDKAYH